MNAIEIDHLRRVYTTTIGTFRRKTKEVVAVDDASIIASYWANISEQDLRNLVNFILDEIIGDIYNAAHLATGHGNEKRIFKCFGENARSGRIKFNLGGSNGRRKSYIRSSSNTPIAPIP